MTLSLLLYGLALALLIYIIFNIAKTGKFTTGDAIATLGIIVSILVAQNPIPSIIFSTTDNSSHTTDSTEPPPTTVDDTTSSGIYDNFDNSAYDGNFNTALWRVYYSTSGSAEQRNGTMGFSGETELLAKKFDFAKISQPSFFQSKLMFGLGQSGGSPGNNVHLKLSATTEQGEFIWFTECNIHYVSDSQAESDCWSADKQSLHVYGSQKTLLNFRTWYTVRMEVNPDTMTFSYYLDGKDVGSQIPTDASLLKNARFTLVIGITGLDTETAYVDDVQFGSK
jgi:hypothetical protein